MAGKPHRQSAGYTKAERQKRWQTCIKYINRYGTLDGARRAAARDRIVYPTSVWITAFSKLVGGVK